MMCSVYECGVSLHRDIMLLIKFNEFTAEGRQYFRSCPSKQRTVNMDRLFLNPPYTWAGNRFPSVYLHFWVKFIIT